jgi:hypothetical protein
MALYIDCCSVVLFMLIVANNPVMLSVVMLSVVMLNVVAPRYFLPLCLYTHMSVHLSVRLSKLWHLNFKKRGDGFSSARHK